MNKPVAKLKLLTTEGEVIDAILYCHQETITLGSTTFYLLKLDTPADASGTTLSASTGSVAAITWGKFVYSLSGISSILAATIYATYRAYTGGGTVNAQINIKIVQSNGTTRTTIATGVSASANLGSAWATYTGANYSFAQYTVVDQTDYLGIDYVANVTVKKATQYAYLRIDDNTLATADQTRSQEWSFQHLYTVTLTEAIGSVTDSTTESIPLRNISITEALGSVVDSPTEAATRVISSTEALGTLTDSPTEATTRVVSSTEALGTLTDSPTEVITRLKSITEDIGTLADSLYYNVEYYKQTTESLGALTDSALAEKVTPVKTINVTEAIGSIVDSTTQLLARAKSISESLGVLTDTPITNLQLPRSITESLGILSDTPVPILIIVRSISEPLGTLTDSPTETIRRSISVTESLGPILDSVTANKLFAVTTIETIGTLTDSVTLAISRQIFILEPLGAITDSTLESIRRYITVLESIGAITDSASTSRVILVSVPESITSLVDTVTATLVGILFQAIGLVLVLDQTVNRIFSLDSGKGGVLTLDLTPSFSAPPISVKLKAYVYTSDATKPAYIRLKNTTTNTVVAGSEMQTNSLVPVLLESNDLSGALPVTGVNNFVVELGASPSSTATCTLAILEVHGGA
jgi:hypothetical protein